MTEAEVLDYINSWIKKNGKKAITGDVLNSTLKYIVQLIVDNTGNVNWGEIDGFLVNQTDLQEALNAKQDNLGFIAENTVNKGEANGYVPLNSSTQIDSTYLPSYVDDVIEVSDFASLPVTGENGKIYVTLDTNLTYRWTGTSYVEISKSLALGETSSTAYRGDRGKIAYDHSQTTGNPHGTTAADVGAVPVGQGLPSGGTSGQILAKIDATNYNTEWIDNYTSSIKHLVKAGESLTKGQAVFISSADGTNMIATKASNVSEATSSQTIGIIAQDLALNDTGFVITEGLLSGLNTNSGNVGDPIFLGVDGALLFGVVNKPVAPAHMVYLGTITRKQSVNGEIFVKVQNGYELAELHDVLINNVTLTNNDVLTYDSATQLWKNKPNAGASGIWGIANTSGVYTYYTTFTLAMAAATAGQTIELFADVTETGAVTVNLKNGVNINLNGHIYILNNSGTANAIQDNGAAVSCIIANGIIKRIGGTASTTNTLCMYVTGASNISCYNLRLIQDLTSGYKTALSMNNASATVTGVYCIGGNPTVSITNGTLLDSNVISLNGGGITNSGIIKNCFGKGLNVHGISNYGTAYNCVGQDDYVLGFDNYGYAFNCVGRSTGAIGYRGGGINYNCSGYSNGGVGYFVNGGTQNYKCFGYSTASNGIAMINGVIDGCTAISTVAAAISTSNSGATISAIKNCHAISYASVAISIANTTPNNIVYKTLAESYWNNAAGHSINVSSSGANAEIIQCILRTVNASANAITSSGAKTVNYGQNVYKGMTTPINANVTQGITNTQDNQGNILI